jgi:hypothetical protein
MLNLRRKKMQKQILNTLLLSIACLIINTSCETSVNPELSKGWNEEPIFYSYEIKSTTLPYLSLSSAQKEQLENMVGTDDVSALKFEIGNIKIELNSSYPPDRDGENGVIASKIDNTISWLNDITNNNSIVDIRASFFTRYRYTSRPYTGCEYWIKGQSRKLENLVTRGNHSLLNQGIREIIRELEKDTEYYKEKANSNNNYWSTYPKIDRTIDYFKNMLTFSNLEALRNSYFLKIIE